MSSSLRPVSVVIPTYHRERVLIETIDRVLDLDPKPVELLVVDQTPHHERETAARLEELSNADMIRLVRQQPPSIPRAMNLGLREASSEIVLFLDDDVIPAPTLIREHAALYSVDHPDLVAGRVIQPWDEPRGEGSSQPGAALHPDPKPTDAFIGCNFSVRRSRALELGGFDENFVRVAYRYEAEFAARLLSAGGKMLFSAAGYVRHLQAAAGGTRQYGRHYRTIKPDHSVGEYYYLLRATGIRGRLRRLLLRPLRAVATRFHLRRPWWIPLTLLSELAGLIWAIGLAVQGPKYISGPASPVPSR